MIAATVAAFAGSTAFAGDMSNTRLEWRFVHGQFMAIYVPDSPKTIAVYAGRTGVTQRTPVQGETPKTRFEYRFNAHGDRMGIHVFDK